MNWLNLLGIAVGLAMDAFAVAIACSITLRRLSFRSVFRVAFFFGLFQGIMPIIGWSASFAAHEYIAAWDHWLAFGLLIFIGGKAIYDALREKCADFKEKDPTRGLSLIVFSIATSIDALAVGISLSALDVDIVHPAIIIGIVTFILSAVGMLIGKRLGSFFGQKIEIIGGLILIGIGTKILISHLLFS